MAMKITTANGGMKEIQRLRLAESFLLLFGLACIVSTITGTDNSNSSSSLRLAHRSLTEERIKEASTMEFVHIPHTGGSLIEMAGGRAGMTWGACHFLSRSEDAGPGCSGNNHEKHVAKMEDAMKRTHRKMDVPNVGDLLLWQTPAHWFTPNLYGFKTTFTMVRDPYSRIVSAYLCKDHGYQGPEEEKRKATTMNNWIVETLREIEEQNKDRANHGVSPFFPNPALLPQVYYVFKYDSETRKVDLDVPLVNHVINYDWLSVEFNQLMAAHNINIEVDEEQPVRDEAILSTSDLSDDAKRAIERIYAEDFKAFHYLTFASVDPSFDSELVGSVRSHI